MTSINKDNNDTQMSVPQMMRHLLRDAFDVLGWRVVAIFSAMLVTGLLEGLGLSLLFPLLAKFGIGDSGATNAVAETIDGLLKTLHIPDTLGAIIIFVVIVFLLQVSFELLRAWIQADNQSRYTESWHKRLFEAYFRANWSFFIRERTANRINAVVTQATRVSGAFYVMMQMATNVVVMLVYFSISLAAAWPVVIIMGTFGAVIYIIARPVARRGRIIGYELTEVSRQLQHRTSEYLQSAKLIKATATEPLVSELFHDTTNDYRQANRQAGFNPSLVLAVYSGAGYIALGSGIWFAIDVLAIDTASVLVSIYIFLRLYTRLTSVQQNLQAFSLSAPALPDVLLQLQGADAAVEDYHSGKGLPQSGPVTINIDNVCVNYGAKAALDGITANIGAGTVTGMTGPSGAGKSTLVDVIIGLLAPDTGTVSVNGISVNELDVSSWRRSVGYVAQDTILMNDTIAANITWGSVGHKSEEIRQAARHANALEFIEALPKGFDTQVGERGVRLSGGQRQRLGLARALMGKKRLLILDEATSALDSESEILVLEALESLRGQVTVLMIAHRLSTLTNADQILFLQNGKIVESGTWSELTSSSGNFSRLWNLQNMQSQIEILDSDQE